MLPMPPHLSLWLGAGAGNGLLRQAGQRSIVAVKHKGSANLTGNPGHEGACVVGSAGISSHRGGDPKIHSRKKVLTLDEVPLCTPGTGTSSYRMCTFPRSARSYPKSRQPLDPTGSPVSPA